MKGRKEKVLVIGSGPIVIGQGAEFDYASAQACMALQQAAYEIVLINNNPATVMTDEQYADTIYFEPLTVESVAMVIKKERPKWLLASVSGQTGLNLATSLEREGILAQYGVEILGTSIDSMEKAENREQFRSTLKQIEAPILESKTISSVEEAVKFMNKVNEAIIVRPAYTLGGTGGGIAHTEEELRAIVSRGLKESPIGQCLLEKSIAGWKEIEFEVLRDHRGNSIIVCQMENVDPVGIHTGDSVVVIPVQTWTKKEQEKLEDAAKQMVDTLGIVGACNVQFALHPTNGTYYFIEVNPRVSRSSALASKATGCPIAYLATEISLGKSLDTLIHPISNEPYTKHSFTYPYVVVKFPRWVFDMFESANRSRGTQMKATGEVVAFEMNIERAFHKAVRSLDEDTIGMRHITCINLSTEKLLEVIQNKEDRTFFAMIELLYKGFPVEELYKKTKISPYFIEVMKNIVQKEKSIHTLSFTDITKDQFLQIKQTGYADEQLASIWQVTEQEVIEKRKQWHIFPKMHEHDVTGNDCFIFSTWDRAEKQTRPQCEKKRILIIGSGPIRIGQGIEFDYCSVHAVRAFQKLGYEVILINNNPATVSTDFHIADRLYMEPLSLEDICNVAMYEQVDGISVQFGGQTALNTAEALEKLGFPLIGTTHQDIEQMEDRNSFYQFMNKIAVPHIPGATVHTQHMLHKTAKEIGYPVLLRPSYVIGGKGMVILHSEEELQSYILKETVYYPILVDRYIEGIEIELDAISDGEHVYIPAIFEHVEKSGVHSGDSISVSPPVTLPTSVKDQIVTYVERIARGIGKPSICNIQLVFQEDTLYVLEVNPRASRTVPVVSKQSSIPFIEYAVRILHGEEISAIVPTIGLGKEQGFYTMKAPVYSTEKLAGIDPKLLPEMQSTGEIMAFGSHIEDIAFQAFFYNEHLFNQYKNNIHAIWIEGEGSKQDALETIFTKFGWQVTRESEMSFLHWQQEKGGLALISWGEDETARILGQQLGLMTISTFETASLLAQSMQHPFVQPKNEWENTLKKEVVYK